MLTYRALWRFDVRILRTGVDGSCPFDSYWSSHDYILIHSAYLLWMESANDQNTEIPPAHPPTRLLSKYSQKRKNHIYFCTKYMHVPLKTLFYWKTATYTKDKKKACKQSLECCTQLYESPQVYRDFFFFFFMDWKAAEFLHRIY